MILRPALLALFLAAAPAWAAEGPPPLGLPLDCAPGGTCWVMNYPDADPGPAARDFTCRPRSYDRHDGTDIALRDVAAQRAGVNVLAAAAGKVISARDGEPDGLWMAGRSAEVKAGGKECGNRVAIAHGDGWVTDYCHLRQGSVMVKPGDVVTAGQPIGQVGLSGMTAFPHAHMALMHFDPGSKTGAPVDPFTQADLKAGCGRPEKQAWAAPMPYQPVSLYAAGFAPMVPDGDAIKNDASTPARLPRDSAGLVLWGTLFGAAPGDRVTLRVAAPDGHVLIENTQMIDRDQAWRMVALERKRPGGQWPAGTYHGTVTLERGGMAPQTRAVAVELP